MTLVLDIIFSDMTILLLIILLAIGAIQGLVYGVILSRIKVKHKTANRFLAAILFFFAYRLIVEILHFLGIGRFDTAYYFLLEFNWIYGALIYFFVVSYVTPDFKISRTHLVHFIPAFIEVIWSFFIKSQNFYWDGNRESLSWLGYWGYVVWMHYPTMYIISGGLIIFYIFKANRILESPMQQEGYQLVKENTTWIKRVIWVMGAFAGLFTVTVLIDFLFFDYAFDAFGYPIFIIMTVITYWLGMEGFAKRNLIAYKEVEIISDKERVLLNEIAVKMKSVMKEQQLFKNPELSLSSLSASIGAKPYLVSKTLSIVFDKKFSDYINELRFESLKKALSNSDNNKYTLLSLAFDAGFNSKSSFNRAVLKITGKSPKYLKSNS